MRQVGLLPSAAALYILLLSSATTSWAGTSTTPQSGLERQMEKQGDSINRPDHEDQSRVLDTSDNFRENLHENLNLSGFGKSCQKEVSQLSCLEQGTLAQEPPSLNHTESSQSLGSNFHVQVRKNQPYNPNSQSISGHEMIDQSSVKTGSRNEPTKQLHSRIPFNSDQEAEEDKRSPHVTELKQAKVVTSNKRGDSENVEHRDFIRSPTNRTTATTDKNGNEASKAVPKVKTQSTTVSFSTPNVDTGRARLLVAVARTLIVSTASTSTLSVLSTCFNTPAANVMTCRKRRRSYKLVRMMKSDIPSDEEVSGLSSSFSKQAEVTNPPQTNRSPRIILWSSQTSTVVFTATTTLAVPVVTASITCTFPGIVICG